MDEQRELDELTRTMTEQQTKLAETMEEMKSKASTLQEKLDRKAELSKTNAELGIKRVALEYKVVELQIPHYQTKVINNQTHSYGEPSSTRMRTIIIKHFVSWRRPNSMNLEN